MSICKMLPRLVTWKDYGITRERLKELKKLCCLPENAAQTLCAAHRASEMLSEYILLSVKKNLSFEGIEYAKGLGRIPCGRTDFYGYRRLFFHHFDRLLKGERIMERYFVRAKKNAKSDFCLVLGTVEKDADGKIVIQLDLNDRKRDRMPRIDIISNDEAAAKVVLESAAKMFAPCFSLNESNSEIWDCIGLMGGNDAKNE